MKFQISLSISQPSLSIRLKQNYLKGMTLNICLLPASYMYPSSIIELVQFWLKGNETPLHRFHKAILRL